MAQIETTPGVEIHITQQGADVMDLADADRALTAAFDSWTIEEYRGDGDWLVTIPTSKWNEIVDLGGVVLQAGAYLIEVAI